MARQVFVFYQKTNPFPGWIRFYGKVDPNEVPDGSTLQEALTALLIKYPDSDIHLFPPGTSIDPEVLKFDQVTSTLSTLDPGDITPEAQTALDQVQKEADIVAGLPSWIAVENTLDTVKANAAAATTLAQLKTALVPLMNFHKKHARITYWLAKNRPD